jgi:hypothetical protein
VRDRVVTLRLEIDDLKVQLEAEKAKTNQAVGRADRLKRTACRKGTAYPAVG